MLIDDDTMCCHLSTSRVKKQKVEDYLIQLTNFQNEMSRLSESLGERSIVHIPKKK